MSSISIIMPSFNAARTIGESIRSVLSQSLMTELIVVDDKSTDETIQVVRGEDDSRIVIVPGPGNGISAALNCGFQAATGDFIARCDADDLYPRDRLAWQLEWLQNHDDYIAVSGGFQAISWQGDPISNLACDGQPRDVTEDLLKGMAVTHFCTWLVRSPAIRKSGGARTWFETAEDADLQFRLAKFGKIWHEPRNAYLYRLHDNSITHSQQNAARKFYEACAINFALQRIEKGHDDLEQGSPPRLPETHDNDRNTANKHMVSLLVGSAWDQYRKGHIRASIGKILTAIRLEPHNFSLWKQLVIMIVKQSIKLIF